MIIRRENPSDIDLITDVAKAAFEDHSFLQQTEHLSICDLRTADALTISLVAEIDGRIVGHIAFSPVTISDGTANWYCLGPVSVLPDYQGCKIGTKLIATGLDLLRSMDGNGCAIVGLPTFFNRFGFENHPRLIHDGVPQEVFVAKSLNGCVPDGTVEFHEAFKQLSEIEKDAIAEVIISYAVSGIRLRAEDPAVEGLIAKEILVKMPDGKFIMRPAALAEYDAYFAQVAQFRATEMSRVHKNPIMAAIRYGK